LTPPREAFFFCIVFVYKSKAEKRGPGEGLQEFANGLASNRARVGPETLIVWVEVSEICDFLAR
jgi:hypothetical protein